MADDAAHIPPGPSADPAAGDAEQAEPAVTADVAVTPGPSFAQYARAIGADIEVIGRGHAPATAPETGGAEEPALVGAAPAAGVNGAGGGGRGPGQTTTVHRAPADTALVEDTPAWSFPGTPRPSSRPGAEPSPVDRNQVELPFPRALEQVTPPPRPQPMFGPVAQSRSTLLVPLLAVLSLGAYALVWHHHINRELEEFDPKLHARPSRSTMAVTVPWALGLLVTVAGALLLVLSRLSIHAPLVSHVSTAQSVFLLAGLLLVPYLTLLLPFSLVAVVMTLERLRCVEEHVGVTTDRQVRPVAQPLLLAIPVVGGLLLLSEIQGRVNATWNAVSPAGPLVS
jgi:hypothetical protein